MENFLLITFIQKNILQYFLSSNKRKLTSNKQKVTSNEQKLTTKEKKLTSKEKKLTSNEQKITSNEQKVSPFTKATTRSSREKNIQKNRTSICKIKKVV